MRAADQDSTYCGGGKVSYHASGDGRNLPGALEVWYRNGDEKPDRGLVAAICRYAAQTWPAHPHFLVSEAVNASVEPAPVPSDYAELRAGGVP